MILYPKKNLWVLPIYSNLQIRSITKKHFGSESESRGVYPWWKCQEFLTRTFIYKIFTKRCIRKEACQNYGLGQVLSNSQQNATMNDGISSEALNAIILASFCVFVFIIILMLSLFVCIWCWWLMLLLLPFIVVMSCFIVWVSLLPSSKDSNNSADNGLTVTLACAPRPRVVLVETTASWRKVLNDLIWRSLSSSA